MVIGIILVALLAVLAGAFTSAARRPARRVGAGRPGRRGKGRDSWWAGDGGSGGGGGACGSSSGSDGGGSSCGGGGCGGGGG